MYNTHIMEAEEEKVFKCDNHEVCGTDDLPTWWLECKGKWLCTNCDRMFGTGTWSTGTGLIYKTGKGSLHFDDVEVECPICLESKRSVSQPTCDHTVCIDCFKRCYYGDSSGEPPFPYLEIEEDTYDEDDDPLIKEWNVKWHLWDDHRQCMYKMEETTLQKCPPM